MKIPVVLVAAAAAACALAGSAAQAAGSPAIPSTLLGALALTSPQVGYGLFVAAAGSQCRGVVGRTADGGASFADPVSVHSWPCASGAQWLLAADGRGDVFLYGDLLFASHDGGKSWAQVSEPGHVLAVSPAGRSVWMLRQTCMTGRSSPPSRCRVHLMISADGGRRWRSSQAQPVTSAFGMVSLRYAEPYQGQDWLVRTSRLTGYVLLPPPTETGNVAAHAPLFYTADGGTSWRRYSIPCGRAMMSVTMTAVPGSAALAAVCAGMPGLTHQVKTVAVSSDGGRTWIARRPCPLDINKGLNCRLEWGYLGDIASPEPGTIFMSGTAISLEVTMDGGGHWRFVRPPPGGSYADTSQVRFFGRSDGFLVGLDQSANETPAIWHTADGGVSWHETIPALG